MKSPKFYKNIKEDHKKYLKFQEKHSNPNRKQIHNHHYILEAVKYISKFNDKYLVDVGCGDGYTLDKFKEYGFKKTLGIDINEEKLKVAEKYGHNVSKEDLHNLSLPTNSVDIIYCRHVFEHMLYPKEVIQEFYRVLKKNGLLFIIVPHTRIIGAHLIEIKSIDKIIDFFKEANFKIIDKQERQLQGLEYWVLGEKTSI